jgi:two-component system, OmpR family, response regulator RegX3
LAKILVAEDDRSLSEALAYNLRRDDHTPVVAHDAVAALELARREAFDLVLLDLMLPGGSGFDVCRAIRSHSTVPIIMLTALDQDVDRILGLEMGADDYVTKPFSLRELLARVNANLRRVSMEREGIADRLEHGPLSIDVRRRRVAVNGTEVTLQPREFDLLAYLMRHPGVVLRREALLQAVWGHEFVGRRTVDVHVRRVRAKLERAGMANPIRTLHGVGYAFESGRSFDETSGKT